MLLTSSFVSFVVFVTALLLPRITPDLI